MRTPKSKAPGLWGVIAFKFGKGILFLALAAGIFTLTDNNLPEDFRNLLQELHFDPERQFWADIAAKLGSITPKNIIWVASGTVLYASVSLLEALGLFLRKPWGGWIAIGEGAFFIPIELYELGHHFVWGLALILVINVVIVAYLWRNRVRLFGGAGGKRHD